MKPKAIFSIIMPAFNAELYIKTAILSVISQTYKLWELIIIDDSSTDSTAAIIKLFLYDKRIKYFKCYKNSGVASARNLGLKKVEGDIICFLDADDYWHSKKLSAQKKYFDKGHKIVYSPYFRILQKGFISFVNVKPKIIMHDFYFFNPVPNLTGSFHKTLLPVQQTNDHHEDYLMWFDLVKRHGEAIATQANIPLAYYRTGNSSLSSNKFKVIFWQWKILRKYFYISTTQAFYYFFIYICHSIKIRANDILSNSKLTNL